MSRRKQAKPRAFLKLGEDCEEEDPLSIHTKEELLLSDYDDQSQNGDDEEDCQLETNPNKRQHVEQQKQQQQIASLLTTSLTRAPVNNGDSNSDSHAAVTESRQANVESNSSPVMNVATLHVTKVQEFTEAAFDNSVDNQAKRNGINEVDEPEFERALPVSPSANIIDSNLIVTDLVDNFVEKNGNKDNVVENIDAAEIDDDSDDDYDDYDLLSLDSYYSDMYSTHTSSSYSPSISDGTITPNSLHQQHLPSQHLQHLQSLQQMHDDTVESERHLNGDGVEPENAANDETANDEQHNEKRKQIKNSSERSNAAAAALEQFKRHGRHQQRPHHHHLHHHHALNAVHGLKMPTKLRKIERDATSAANGGDGGGDGATAGKLNKLTGEGIKNNVGSSGNNPNADGSYQCQFCDKSFPRLGYLKKHEQSHAEHLPFKCEYCARLFKHKRSRDRHTKLHTGDRRYRCPHCEAAFSRSDHLKIHMKTHDNQKPFQCTICNRGYNTAAALTSHMQNHKKQAALLAAGGNPQAINYSPRSTGSASSNGSLHKRRYGMTASIASDSSPSRLDYPSKRLRPSYMNCSYCGKSDFNTIEQLNTHMQTLHEKELAACAASSTTPLRTELPAFQLSCEYCTMKLPNIPALFQHMRSTHVDRLSSPNSYFEHFNRLAASGTFSPRLGQLNKQRIEDQQETSNNNVHIKIEETSNLSPKSGDTKLQQEDEPTDLSAKRRSVTPTASNSPKTAQHASPHSSPTQQEKPPGVFFCNQCSAGLPDFESFRNHLKTHITQGLSMICHHCGLTLRDHAEYERHVISHFLIAKTEYNCTSNCSKSYTKPEELQKHLMDQHVVTMYKCAICAELFDSKVSIQVHFACAHSTETKLLRCSACMEVFRAESDFNLHVKTRHQQNGSMPAANSLQCMFCRTVCGSELEMHFHLAAHARQFRCPSCPETFHVEFLLDRHMQSQHGGNEQKTTAPPPLPSKDSSYDEPQIPTPGTPNNLNMSPMNSLYVNALFGKAAAPLMPLNAQNNNNSILDYNVAFAAAHLKNGLFPAAAAAASKFYSPLQVDTNAIKHHPALMYGLSQRYFDTNRTLLDMYAQQQQEKSAASGFHNFISPKQITNPTTVAAVTPQDGRQSNEALPPPPSLSTTPAGFSCGICERNDFRTETEVHTHRKIVHNMKTGVSLRCAYCSGNFKSRSELEHHMKTCHNSTGKHKCLICDEIFPSPAILAEHKLQHSKVGQSGRCSHCSKPLNDVAAFKDHLTVHNTEGQMPVQCICCRQSLHSEFEIGLHAKFHTKSSSMPESVCALCLEPMPNVTITEAKVCEKCCRKHNLNSKYHQHQQQLQQHQHQQQQQQHHIQQLQHNKQRDYDERLQAAAQLPNARQHIENRCNLCKIILPHAQKLQEHLVEHTFAGCEERGFNCYICSSVFTAPSGLLQHMHEHGANARPYDCNLCTDKFYFRAELDHHLVEHELRAVVKMQQEIDKSKLKEHRSNSTETHEERVKEQAQTATPQVKQELIDEADNKSNAADDDEYIEVEQVAEQSTERESNKAENNARKVEEAEQNGNNA